MSARSGIAAAFGGTLLLLAGLGLIGFAAWLNYWPMEEPAAPGKTPNPSLMEREVQRSILLIRIALIAAPVAGLALAAGGVWLLAAGRRPPMEPG